MFTKATKAKSKLRLGIEGPSGSGKTTAALNIATGLGGEIAFIDTEHGSASLYSDTFSFDVLNLTPPYSPERFIEAIKSAESGGYNCIVIDSMTHEWDGVGGCLDILNSYGGRFTDWAKVTPRHQAFVDAILQSSCHVIGTWRTKTEYSIDTNNKGKVQPKKVGTAPKQREGLEYEFTAVFSLNQQHYAEASKDRTRLFDGLGFYIDQSTGEKLSKWLNDGQDVIKIQIDTYKNQIAEAKTIDDLKNAFGQSWQFANRQNLEIAKQELKQMYDRTLQALSIEAQEDSLTE